MSFSAFKIANVRGVTAVEYVLIASAVVLAFSLLHSAHCSIDAVNCRPPLEKLSSAMSDTLSVTSLLLQLPF